MTVFGAVYTVIGYRLVEAPFSLAQGLIGSIFLVYLVGTVSSSRPAGWSPASAAAARCTWRSPRRPPACCSPSRTPCRGPAGPGPDHRGLLRGPRGGLVVGEPDGEDGPRPGVGALPVRVLRRQQRRRHARRGRLPRGRLGGHGALGLLAVLGVVSITLYVARRAVVAERLVDAARSSRENRRASNAATTWKWLIRQVSLGAGRPEVHRRPVPGDPPPLPGGNRADGRSPGSIRIHRPRTVRCRSAAPPHFAQLVPPPAPGSGPARRSGPRHFPTHRPATPVLVRTRQ